MYADDFSFIRLMKKKIVFTLIYLPTHTQTIASLCRDSSKEDFLMFFSVTKQFNSKSYVV